MAENMQCQFANWYRSENSHWTAAARRYLEDLPDLVDDAVQDGWINGDRQLQKQESKVADLWLDSQHGSEHALDQLRGYMFRVVRNAACDLRRKELGQWEELRN